MSSNFNNDIAPVPTLTLSPSREDVYQQSPESPSTEKKVDFNTTVVHPHSGPTIQDAHQSVGLSVIEQTTAIPQTGERMITTRREYWLYIVYCT